MDPDNALKNQTFTIKITGIGSEGQGVGRLENGYTVFVPGALPDETVSVLIIAVKAHYLVGKLTEVAIPSPSRANPPCPADSRCGGCGLLHCSYPYQLELKQRIVEQTLARIGKFEDPAILPIIGMAIPFRYRNKSSFPIRVENGLPVMGFYSRRSHRVTPVSDCLVEPGANAAVIQVINEYVKSCGVSVYDENAHKGLLRHVLTRVGFSSGELLVCLVINGKGLPRTDQLIDVLKKRVPGFTALALNINTERTNVIMGVRTYTLFGPGTIRDNIGDLRFEISPASFFQVNPAQAKVLYGVVLKFAGLTGNETVIDAYCGIGAISLFMAKSGGAKHVYGVEIVPQAVADAKRNAHVNNIKNVSFFADSVENWLTGFCGRNNVKPDVIVVDPPRKGCGAGLLQLIADLRPRKVIYVSCDTGTFARDARLLCDAGYSLVKVQPVDMFPQTAHVECAALFIV